MDRKVLLKQVEAMLQDDDLAEAIAEMFEEQSGGMGFLLRTLKSRPRTFNPYVFKGTSILRQPANLDLKTAELVAIGVASALRCEYCLEAHINAAVAAGASFDEVLDAILVAGAIAESSTLSVALRQYKKLETKQRAKNKRES